MSLKQQQGQGRSLAGAFTPQSKRARRSGIQVPPSPSPSSAPLGLIDAAQAHNTPKQRSSQAAGAQPPGDGRRSGNSLARRLTEEDKPGQGDDEEEEEGELGNMELKASNGSAIVGGNSSLVTTTAKRTAPISRASLEIGRSTYFNDPIHQNIKMESLCLRIIDTPEFQRLSSLKQLGTCHFVYRGATHTRFEHSLGVAHLAYRVAHNLRVKQPELGITDEDLLCVKVAGLCHDLGHGPFSHVYDGVFIRRMHPRQKRSSSSSSSNAAAAVVTPEEARRRRICERAAHWRHEDGSVQMFQYILSRNRINIEEYGLNDTDLLFIVEIIGGVAEEKRRGRGTKKFFLYDIVNNTRSGLDVDKLDYFLRDMRYSNAVNASPIERFIEFGRVYPSEPINSSSSSSSSVWTVNETARGGGGEEEREEEPSLPLMICYPEKMVREAVDIFALRFRLHQTVYTHKSVKKVEFMVVDALELADPFIRIAGSVQPDFPDGQYKLSECIFDMQALATLNDSVLEIILHDQRKQLQPAKTIIHKILSRKLYHCLGKSTYYRGDAVDAMNTQQIEDELIRISAALNPPPPPHTSHPSPTHLSSHSSHTRRVSTIGGKQPYQHGKSAAESNASDSDAVNKELATSTSTSAAAVVSQLPQDEDGDKDADEKLLPSSQDLFASQEKDVDEEEQEEEEHDDDDDDDDDDGLILSQDSAINYYGSHRMSLELTGIDSMRADKDGGGGEDQDQEVPHAVTADIGAGTPVRNNASSSVSSSLFSPGICEQVGQAAAAGAMKGTFSASPPLLRSSGGGGAGSYYCERGGNGALAGGAKSEELLTASAMKKAKQEYSAQLERSHSLILERGDLIVEKMHVHYGQKQRNPVANMRFFQKDAATNEENDLQLGAECINMPLPRAYCRSSSPPLGAISEELLNTDSSSPGTGAVMLRQKAIGKQIPERAYESFLPRVFEEMSVRVFCRDPRKIHLARKAMELWARQVGSHVPFPSLSQNAHVVSLDTDEGKGGRGRVEVSSGKGGWMEDDQDDDESWCSPRRS